MPSTNARQLTLSTVGANTTIGVTYNVVFSSLERALAAQGIIFRERIRVIGVDPPGGTTGTILRNFPAQDIPVPPPGPGSATLQRIRSMEVPRAALQEDAGLGDNDEIRCRIDIELIGLPTSLTDQFTNQSVLVG